MSKVRDWDFCDNPTCGSANQVAGMRDPGFLRPWLARFKTDPGSMIALRQISQQQSQAVNRFQTSDDEVLSQLAGLLESGRLHVHSRSARSSSGGGGGGNNSAPPSEAQTSVPFPVSDRRKELSDSRPVQPADPATFSDNMDGSKQAAALTTAAAQGAPFCPE